MISGLEPVLDSLVKAAPDPAQHWAAVVGIVVGILAIIGAVYKAARWLDARNEATTEHSVRKVLLGEHDERGDIITPGVLIPAVEAAVTTAVQPIRDEQARVYEDLREHMTLEAESMAAQVEAHAQHIEDDREFQVTITQRLDEDARRANEDHALMLGLLRDALHGQVDPHPDPIHDDSVTSPEEERSP